MPLPVTRRQALLAALSLPVLVSGCTRESESTPEDPDRVALENALEVETELFETVGSLEVRGREALGAMYAVQAHVAALGEALGQPSSLTPEMSPLGTTSPTPSASPPSRTTLPETIRAADRATDAHTKALRTASAQITPLLASVAASDAAIAALLRGISE